MRTAVRRVLLLSALMSPGVLQALGLGDIHLNSALNQPFDAEIELVSATADDLGALRASLASGDTFARYGLDRPAFLSDFAFRVTKGEGGKDVLRVTSPRAVTEPFVTLLVEANWPRGRLLREYTVLLDPPVYAPAPASPKEAAVATPRVTSGADTDASPREAPPVRNEIPAGPRPQRAAPAATASIEPGSSYSVRPNDTLWRIASAAHPGTRSDVNRAMVSIYQQNPAAFEGNINVLRSGSTLRIPRADEVASVSAAAASAEVARQYAAWRDGRAAAGASAGADAGRLRLVTPEQGTTAPSTATATPAATSGKPAPAAAAATAAAAPAAGASGAAPVSVDARVKQLEAELAEAKRLLEVRNAELATLQGGSGAAVPAEASTTAAAPGETTPTAPTAAGTPAAAGEPTAAGATAPAEPAAAAPAKKEEKKPAPVTPPGPSLLEQLMGYWWVLVALLAAIGGALLFKRLRTQRGSAEAELEDAMARDLRSTTRTPAVTRPRDGSGIVVEEKRGGDTNRVAPAAAAATAATVLRTPEPARKPAAVEDTLSGDGPASMESGDPLAEADFHMAYGLYDQAADLVQLAMKREPKRRDLKLKLLEIFFVWGNKDRFLQLAADMNATRAEAPAGEWDKITIMGKQIAPNDAMFTGASISSGSALDLELLGATGTIDMSLFPGDAQAPDLDVGSAEESRADSSGIDFVLDEPVRGADEDPNAGPTVETPQVTRVVDDSSSGPTIETPQVRRGVVEDTQEVPVESLGLDLDTVRGLEALDAPDTVVVKSPPATTGSGANAGPVTIDGDDELDVDLDMIGSTALMKMSEDTQEMLRAAGEPEAGIVDLTDSTGFMPMLDSVGSDSGDLHPSAVDYDLGGEPATMSEVGTKLDLARAYMDMGDPEGARSILDEVLEEGSAGQRQEAERLIASLP